MVRRGRKYYFLFERAVATSTLHRYSKAVNGFKKWVKSVVRDGDSFPMDILMCDYIHHLFSNGVGKVTARAVYYGMRLKYPELCGSMPMSQHALRGYNRLKPSKSYPPMPYSVLMVISLWMCFRGYVIHSLGLLLSFDCYLRLGELLNLQYRDIYDMKYPRFGEEPSDRMYLRLRHTKTGDDQGVEVESSDVKHLLRVAMTRPHYGTDSIFQFSSSMIRKLIRRACVANGIDVPFVPHSLRHGGATRDYMNGRPIEDIMMRGRWSSSNMTRRYIQTGRQRLIAQHIPRPVSSFGLQSSRDYLYYYYNALSQSTM